MLAAGVEGYAGEGEGSNSVTPLSFVGDIPKSAAAGVEGGQLRAPRLQRRLFRPQRRERDVAERCRSKLDGGERERAERRVGEVEVGKADIAEC